jgi:hypothetical protein
MPLDEDILDAEAVVDAYHRHFGIGLASIFAEGNNRGRGSEQNAQRGEVERRHMLSQDFAVNIDLASAKEGFKNP